MMQSAVSFTGWTVADEPIIPSMVRHAWCHRVGYRCDVQQPESDTALLLPLVRSRLPNASADETVHVPVLATPPTKAAMPSSVESAEVTSESTEGDTIHVEGERTLSDLAQAKQQGFLPVGSAGVSVVAIQVRNGSTDIGLGDAYRICRSQATQLCRTAGASEDVLSVLCMTGAGRVTSRFLPRAALPTVLVLVETEAETDPSTSTDRNTFVGLVLNGFNEQLVGRSAKAMLEDLSTRERNEMKTMYGEEGMDPTLAAQYALIAQQQKQATRLPGDYNVGRYEEPCVANEEKATASNPTTVLPSNAAIGKTPATAAVTTTTLSGSSKRSSPPAIVPRKVSSGVSRLSTTVARGKSGTTTLAPSLTSPRATLPWKVPGGVSRLSTNSAPGKSGKVTVAKSVSGSVPTHTAAAAATEVAAPPLDAPSSAYWSHRDITVTSEGIERHLRVYWVA